jgi:hypothetical protein
MTRHFIRESFIETVHDAVVVCLDYDVRQKTVVDVIRPVKRGGSLPLGQSTHVAAIQDHPHTPTLLHIRGE